MARGTDLPISQKTPAYLAQHYLGNWEIGNGYRYIFPNFPISRKTPAQMGQHDLGSWEIWKWLEVHISQFPQFPKRPQPIWPSTIWEIGKLGTLDLKLM